MLCGAPSTGSRSGMRTETMLAAVLQSNNRPRRLYEAASMSRFCKMEQRRTV
jgi:hypothetical protein